MAIGKCINCDKEILRKINGKWEDIEYHSITFKRQDGNFQRLAFCKRCHDYWSDERNSTLTDLIQKHLESCIREEMKQFEGLKMIEIITKDGPLTEEDTKDGVKVWP